MVQQSKKERDKESSSNVVLPILVVVSVSCLVLAITKDFLFQRKGGSAHAITSTANRLWFVSFNIRMIVDGEAGIAPQTAEEFPLWLKKDRHLANLLDEESERLLDIWGSPIQLIVRSPTDYALVSFGPNRKGDGCGGDDIVCNFNPQMPLGQPNEKGPQDLDLRPFLF